MHCAAKVHGRQGDPAGSQAKHAGGLLTDYRPPDHATQQTGGPGFGPPLVVVAACGARH
jgi:hypothetical protein